MWTKFIWKRKISVIWTVIFLSDKLRLLNAKLIRRRRWTCLILALKSSIGSHSTERSWRPSTDFFLQNPIQLATSITYVRNARRIVPDVKRVAISPLFQFFICAASVPCYTRWGKLNWIIGSNDIRRRKKVSPAPGFAGKLRRKHFLLNILFSYLKRILNEKN